MTTDSAARTFTRRARRWAQIGLVALVAHPAAARAQEQPWTIEASLYFLAASMSGEVAIAAQTADVDVPFSDILENLKAGVMGSARVGYERWAFTTEAIYMSLGIAKGNVSADVEQTVIEPSVSYRVLPEFEALAGARYVHLSTAIAGPFGRRDGSVDWWDPIVGGKGTYAFTPSLSGTLRADVGGFGVGSEFSWQLYPYLGWQFTRWGSLQAGYRWLSVDYEQGSGPNQFRYDVVTEGPQLGATFHFDL